MVYVDLTKPFFFRFLALGEYKQLTGESIERFPDLCFQK